MNRTVIGMVGFGASGLSFLAQFVETLTDPSCFEVFIFDPDAEGLGDAFRSQPSYNLMNTSVEITSLFKNKPDDFRDWLNEHPLEWKPFLPEKKGIEGNEIVPRFLFGRYLSARREAVLKACADKGLKLTRIQERIVDLVTADESHTLISEFGKPYPAQYVLLFTGNIKRPVFPSLQNQPGFIDSIYHSETVWKSIPENGSVLVIGTKLSSIDAILRVTHERPDLCVVAASRTGELPAPNHSIDLKRSRANPWLNRVRFEQTRKAHPELGVGGALNELLHHAWKEVGASWDVDNFLQEDPTQRLENQVTAQHPHHEELVLPLTELLEAVWEALDFSERAEILTRYFKPIMHYVGAFPMANAKELVRLRQGGRLQILKDLSAVEVLDDGDFRARFKDGSTQRFDSVIDASGYDNALSAKHISPLMQSIVDKKLLNLNGFGGLKVSPSFEVESSQIASTHIYSAGFPIKASVPFANWFNRIVAATHKIAHRIAEGDNAH